MATKTASTRTLGRWKPMIEVPEIVPSISFLEGDEVIDFLVQYNDSADKKYSEAGKTLKVLGQKDTVVYGSNPFAAIHARDTARAFTGSEGIRLATQLDLERALKADIDLIGTYEDTGLVLRTAGDSHAPNDYLAKDLAQQVKARDPKLGKLKDPVVIMLDDLDLRADPNSKYGLAFVIQDNVQLINGGILRTGGQFYSQDIDLHTGLPKELSRNGNRTSYVTEQGLSRLCLGRGLDLGCSSRGLAGSDGSGRVALVRGEAARAEFMEKLQADMTAHKSELESRYQADKTALDERYATAIRFLEGKK